MPATAGQAIWRRVVVDRAVAVAGMARSTPGVDNTPLRRHTPGARPRRAMAGRGDGPAMRRDTQRQSRSEAALPQVATSTAVQHSARRPAYHFAPPCSPAVPGDIAQRSCAPTGRSPAEPGDWAAPWSHDPPAPAYAVAFASCRRLTASSSFSAASRRSLGVAVSTVAVSLLRPSKR